MEAREDNLETTSLHRGKSTVATPHTRSIAVHAVGEVKCQPDVFTLTVTITSTKSTLEEAQTSIKRRHDYIHQVLRNNGLRDNNIQSYSQVTRGHGVQVVNTLVVETGDLGTCVAVKNTIVEKLDSSVTCEDIVYRHSPRNKMNKREEAFKAAVLHAKSKAQSVCQTLGVRLGPVMTLTEQGLDESRPNNTEDDGERDSMSGDRGRLTDSTFIYTSTINTMFEVVPISCKKCNKHS